MVHKNVIPVVPSRRKKEPTPPIAKVKVEKARETSEKVRRRRAPSPPLPSLDSKRSKESGGVRGREKKVYKKGRIEEEGNRRSRHLHSDLEQMPAEVYGRVGEEEETTRNKRRRDEEATRGGSSVANNMRKDKGVKEKERVQDGKGGSGARREVGKGEGMQRKASEGRVEKRSDTRGLDDLTEKLKLRKERFGLEAEGGKEVERSARKRRWND